VPILLAGAISRGIFRRTGRKVKTSAEDPIQRVALAVGVVDSRASANNSNTREQVSAIVDDGRATDEIAWFSLDALPAIAFPNAQLPILRRARHE
jgi:hypothetical protein